MRVRLLPFAAADGARNMAADEALLTSAEAGTGSLRFYQWSQPTVSLGYFQPQRHWRDDAALAALPCVRRPSGGAMLVHHHELTYALALPRSQAGHSGAVWLQRMHALSTSALASLRVEKCELAAATGPPNAAPLCFQQYVPADVMLGGAKVVGSAQRRRRGALLQHGAILLACSPFAPALPGIFELTGRRIDPGNLRAALEQTLRRQAGWELTPSGWTEAEVVAIDCLVRQRYTQGSWNGRR